MIDSVRKNAIEGVLKDKKSIDVHGAGNDFLTEPTPVYNNAPSEKVFAGQNNSFIILGRDRPGDRNSGYGGLGARSCGSVDIVAGRVSAMPREVTEDQERVVVNNSIPYDAARITIVQKTDGDKNHYLEPGNVGNRTSSFVILKADNVRIISREGIKLVTGIDNHLSDGRTRTQKFGIDLIANNSGGLQPIPKGDNLQQALDKAYDLIAKNNSEIAFLYKLILRLEAQLAAHVHPSAAGPTGPSPTLIAQSVTDSVEIGAHFVEAQVEQINIAQAKVNYLKPYGSKYINSSWNRTN